MSTSAAQSAAFFDEVTRERLVWGIRDEGGFPAPRNPEGHRAMPFWSLRSRAQRVVDTVRAYDGFEPVEITLEAFREQWLRDLERDDLRVGLNWSGPRATGFDFPAADVADRLAGP